MIEVRRKDLNKAKLDELLKSKMDTIVSEYVSDCVRHSSHMSTRVVEDFKEHVMSSDYLNFTNDGRFKAHFKAHQSLTIEDLIDNDILDEEFGVYHISYNASQESYSLECRLLGIYSSFTAVKSQLDRIRNCEDDSRVVEIDDLEIKYVVKDVIADVYLDGYVE